MLRRVIAKMSVKKLSLATLFVTFFATAASAAPQPHPRLWLDDTAMARMQAARTANTPEWQRLKNWGDARIGLNLNEGYQYLDWDSYVRNYGLLFQITGNPVYGNEGVKYLKAMLRDRNAIGDGLGGPNAIQIDSGYVSRSLGAGVAVGRDWLDGAPDLTPAIIAECTARMNDWYPWIHRPQTYGINEPWVNYWSGHFAMTYTAFISFEGDPGYNPVWETKSEQMWAAGRDIMNTVQAGGDYTEGWNYGHRAMRQVIGYPWALETGTDRANNHWGEINYPNEVVRAHINMLHPSRQLTSDDGRWTGDFKGDPRATTAMMMSVVSDTDAQTKGLARWYATNLNIGDSSDPWEGMLYTDRTIAPIAPTAATMGGYTWKGFGHAVSRGADWSDLNASFVDVVGWTDYGIEANFGCTKFTSRQELLLIDGNTYQLEGQYTNMPRIAGTHTYAPYQEYWHDPAVMTVEGQDGVYTYFKLANLDYLYNGVNDDNPSAAYFQRDIAFLAPDHLIVFDNIRSKTAANTVAEQWYLMGNPTISGNTATLTRPNAKLFARTMAPAVTLSKTNTNSSRPGSYRLDAVPTSNTTTTRFVTAFEAGGTSQSAMTPIVTQTGFGMTGVHIQDPAAPMIVLFSVGENSSQTSATFTFTPVAANTRVVLTGMQAGAAFAVATSPNPGGGIDVNAFVSPGAPNVAGANGSVTFVVPTIVPGQSDQFSVF